MSGVGGEVAAVVVGRHGKASRKARRSISADPKPQPVAATLPMTGLHEAILVEARGSGITRRWDREGIFRQLAAREAAPKWRRRLEVG